MNTTVELEDVADEHTQYMAQHCHNLSKYQGVLAGPSGCFFNSDMKATIDALQHFEVYPDDVWIVSFPKSGTTWSQEMVWLLVNDLDYATAKSVSLRIRSPCPDADGLYIHHPMFRSLTVDGGPLLIRKTVELGRPRCIKTHMPVQLLPSQLWIVKPKVIYVSRDPRDVVLSFYNHYRFMEGYGGTLNKFKEAFLASRIICTPYWRHNLDFFMKKGEPHILFNTYKEMKQDLLAVVKKTSTFLGKEYSDVQLAQLCEHLSFQNMRTNKSVNYERIEEIFREGRDSKEKVTFMRSGISGGWKTTMPQHFKDRFEEWNKKHLEDVPESYVSFLHD